MSPDSTSIYRVTIRFRANAKRGNLIHSADQALYQAKENGRNQVSGALDYNFSSGDAEAS